MNPHLITKSETILAGMTFYSDCFTFRKDQQPDDEIARLWDRFSRFMDSHTGVWRHLADPDIGYQIHIGNLDPKTDGSNEIFVGMEVQSLTRLPAQLSVKVLPSGRYAVFTLNGSQMTDNWPQQVYRMWLPQAGYQPTSAYIVQVYDSRYQGIGNPATEIDIAIPVR